MNTISVKELRENFARVKMGIQQGKTFLLIYRSRPFAHLKPIEPEEEEMGTQSDKERIAENLRKVRSLMGGLKLGKGMTPKEMNAAYDRDVYGGLLS